ncbi:MAG: hypothetical protein HY748_10970 [Elusimicrobia bacterium]|nr:hypothetical protein [Elusimicrobiota bacterium]
MSKTAIWMTAAALVFALSSARAELPALDFDQGIDVSDVLKTARANAAEQKRTAKAMPVRAFYTRYDRDCAHFSIGPNDNPQTSEVWLRSTEWVEECYPGPNPPPYPNPPYPPYPRPYRDVAAHSGHGPNGQNCYERPGRTYQERASVSIRDRQPLLPWEYDSFDVCLEGPWLSLYQRETAYQYLVVQGGNYDGKYVLSPVKKIRMKPDPAGIVTQSFAADMALTLKDRWASYYANERTVLVLKLRKDVPNWFDATLLEKELTVPAAETYAVDFNAFASEFSQKLEAGKKYYVDYSFKRLGVVSKDTLMKVGETDRAVYQPAPAAVGR